MPMVVNTNQGSLSAQRSLAASGMELKQAMERLSSGKKINSAADDAAGFAIAERMTAQIRGLNMATKNANDGLSMLATVENATNDVTDMLQRIRELAVQAANDTNSLEDRTFLQTEVNSLLQEINRVATQTIYNNKVVLDGTLSGDFQVGTEKGQTISFDIKSIDTDTLKLTDLDDGNVDVTSEKTFDDGTYVINTALMDDDLTDTVVHGFVITPSNEFMSQYGDVGSYPHSWAPEFALSLSTDDTLTVCWNSTIYADGLNAYPQGWSEMCNMNQEICDEWVWDGEAWARSTSAPTSINEPFSVQSKNLIRVIDALGRIADKDATNRLLFYIYDNGEIEKNFIIE